MKHDLLNTLSAEAAQKPKRRPQPSWIAPMLGTLANFPFSGKDWLFERKMDGERCLAFRQGDQVRLLSRSRKDLNNTYPELVDAIQAQPQDSFIVDGEVVAFEDGSTSFSRLQERMHIDDAERARRSKVAIYYYLFDLLYLDGYDLTELSLIDRKGLLEGAISFKNPLRFSAHRRAEGEKYYREACRKGWEGVMAKRANGRYIPRRSTDWLKLKCVNEQEFVIGGYTDPRGGRIGFGALLLGYYVGKDLIYVGKVGTGFSDETISGLGRILSSLEQRTSPFATNDFPEKGIHWVKPTLVAEIAFGNWTRDGKLRQARFLGLRRDKAPREIELERR